MEQVVSMTLKQALREHNFSVVINTYLTVAKSHDVNRLIVVLDEIGVDINDIPSSENEPLDFAEILLRLICEDFRDFHFSTNNDYKTTTTKILNGLKNNQYQLNADYSPNHVLELLVIIALLPAKKTMIKTRLKHFYELAYHTFKYPLIYPAYVNLLLSDGYQMIVEAVKNLVTRFNYSWQDNQRIKEYLSFYEAIYEQLQIEQNDDQWILIEIYDFFSALTKENPTLATTLYTDYFKISENHPQEELKYPIKYHRLLATSLYLNKPQQDLSFANKIIQEIMRNEILSLPISSQFLYIYSPLASDATKRNDGLKKMNDKSELIALFNKYYYGILIQLNEDELSEILLAITNLLGPLYVEDYTMESKDKKQQVSKLIQTKTVTKEEIEIIRESEFQQYFLKIFANQKLQKNETYYGGFLTCLYNCRDFNLDSSADDFQHLVEQAMDHKCIVFFTTAHYTLVKFSKPDDMETPSRIDKSFIFFPFFKGIERLIIKIIDDFFYKEKLVIKLNNTNDNDKEETKKVSIFSTRQGDFPWAHSFNLAEKILILTTLVETHLDTDSSQQLFESLDNWRTKVRNPLAHEYIVDNDQILYSNYFSNIVVVNDLLKLYAQLLNLGKKKANQVN